MPQDSAIDFPTVRVFRDTEIPVGRCSVGHVSHQRNTASKDKAEKQIGFLRMSYHSDLLKMIYKICRIWLTILFMKPFF